MRTDDANATPAERVHDGANFERADRRVLFGQHFAGISGAGPLVGPILAAQMGYLPSVMWIILGVIIATVGVAATACIAVFSGRKKNREKEVSENSENTNIEKTENINKENN